MVFIFPWQRGKKKCSFLGQLVEETRLLPLVQPIPSIQTPPSLASRGAAKERNSSQCFHREKRHCKFCLRAADWQTSARLLAARAGCAEHGLRGTRGYLLPAGEGTTGTSPAPCRHWECQAVGNQDSLLGSQVTAYLVLSERLDF